MKLSLYGLPCSGKTTLLNNLKYTVIHGSDELNRITSGTFASLTDKEKIDVRYSFATSLKTREDSFIIDGHYSFFYDIVFTSADAELYDAFFYLYCSPDVIKERLYFSDKNRKYSELSVEHIKKWQEFEIAKLRNECHIHNKDFYVLKDITPEDLQKFIDIVEHGFSSYSLAKQIVDKITEIYSVPCTINLVDGDKTLIMEDSFKVCSNGYSTHVFDGDYYTGYQSLLFSKELTKFTLNKEYLNEIHINEILYKRIKHKKYVILSSGIPELWSSIAKRFDFPHLFVNPLISADTKYYVAKLLQNQGYYIIAFGDSKNDLYLLNQANEGYLCINQYLSRSLKNVNLNGISLLYDKTPYILSDNTDDSVDDILICKSNSGINGSRLAAAHINLGRILGQVINKCIPSFNTSVLVLERGGRFFGDGVYSSFGGVFYSYNPKMEQLPDIKSNIVLVVDSVINTGKSILNVVTELKRQNPNVEIIIISNVIQRKALNLLQDYKIFAIRTSDNSFVGSKQIIQKGGQGPDTADRLFNHIE